MFDSMMFRGLITDITSENAFEDFIAPDEQRHNKDFSEAKRAAEWILNS